MISTLKAIAAAALAIVSTAALCIVIYAVKLRPAAVEEGRVIERADVLNQAMETIKKRSLTNEDIQRLPPEQLCAAIDGMFVNGKCQ